MKLAYLNNVPFAHGHVSVVLSNNADKVMAHSCKLAGAAHDAGLGVLLINCGMNDRVFREHAAGIEDHRSVGHRLTSLDEKPQLVIHTSVRGDLVCEGDQVSQLVRNLRIGIVIISGWEWASSCWRRKEALLFYLRELMAAEDVAVIVYSQASTKPVKGAYDRGGIGKLAMMACAVIRDDASVILDKVAPMPIPMVTTEKDWEEAERSAQLLALQINGLQGENGEVVSRQSLVVSRGKKKGKRANIKDKKPVKSKEKVLRSE